MIFGVLFFGKWFILFNVLIDDECLLNVDIMEVSYGFFGYFIGVDNENFFIVELFKNLVGEICDCDVWNIYFFLLNGCFVGNFFGDF